MAGVKISGLPVIPVAPALTDIFPEVQPASGGTTYKTTFQQLLTLYQPSIPLTNAGNPNGVVAGTTYQFLWDTTNNKLWICTTTGNAGAAVWTTAGSFTPPLAMSLGGTGANLTAANGAIPYSTASAIALLAAGSTGQLFRSGGVGAPTWTTSTYPATNAINTIMYASSSNVLGVITPVNSALMISSSGGVPSWSNSAIPAFTMAGALNMGTHLINNVVDPVSAQDAATKNYVDTTALNGTSVYAASAATLGTVTQSGAGVGATLTNAGVQATFALDGVNPPVGSVVLIKNTATGMTAANEGIYTVTSVGSGATNWVLTRATSYDTPTEINNTGLIVVQNGSTLQGTAWLNLATIVTVDTTSFNYTKFGGTTSIDQVKVTVLGAGSSTYTPTSGLQYVTVEIIGAGGGGGGCSSSANAGAASSGSGAGYCRKTYTAAQIGATAAVVVGTGGTAGAAGATDGVAGGNSTFTPAGAGAVLTASGGGKGKAGSNAATVAFSAAPPDAGGTGTNGDLNIAGSLGSTGQGLATSIIVPAGGASYLGTIVQTSLAGGGPYTGAAGTGYGSGGSGGASVGASGDAAGGAGANGVCYITEYIAA